MSTQTAQNCEIQHVKTKWLLDAHVMHPRVWKLENSLYGLQSDPKRWLERLENILTQAGFVSNQLELCLWAHAGKQYTIQEVPAEFSTDLELVADEVTYKPSRYLDQVLVKTSAG